MELYKEGQEVAFNELHLRYRSKVYGYLKVRLGDTSMVDDVYQNVFMKLHRTRVLYNPKYKFPVWLFTIVKTSLIDKYRSSGRYKPEELNEELLIQKENIEDGPNIEEEINHLSALDQKAIQLRYYDDKSFDEIAKELKVSPVNARKKVSRAISSLRRIFTGGQQ